MLRLLKIDLSKMYYSTAFKVFVPIYYLMVIGISIILAIISFPIGPINIKPIDMGIFDFPVVWHINAWCGAFMKFFLAIIVVTGIANEFSNRTLKQNLIDGMSKSEFWGSKIYSVALMTLVSTFFVAVMSLVMGLIYSESVGNVFEGTEYLLGYFVRVMAFLSMCMLIAVMLKKSALTFLVVFGWWIIEVVISAIDVQLISSGGTFSKYLPLQAMSNTFEYPLMRLGPVRDAVQMTGQPAGPEPTLEWGFMLVSLAYMVLFFWLAYRLIQKRDL